MSYSRHFILFVEEKCFKKFLFFLHDLAELIVDFQFFWLQFRFKDLKRGKL